MSVLSRLRGRSASAAGATGTTGAADDAEARTTQELLDEIDALTRRNRERPKAELEHRVLALRHRAALQLIDESDGSPEYASASAGVAVGESGLPEVEASEMTAAGLRAAILSHGCLLVRGLLDDDESRQVRGRMDRAFEARDGNRDEALYREFAADPRFDLSARDWIGGRSNLWGVDAPRAMVDLFDIFERTGLRSLAEGYLGERPAISVNKCTLRRVYPDDFAGNDASFWHQDGAFLGDVRALNVWLSLSRCGDVAPGLDIVPRRLEEIVPTGTEGATFDWSVSQAIAEDVAGDKEIVRPIFEPGDVLLFDELLLHATGAEADMPDPRYAVECWFFGPSAFPADYAPVAS